MKPYDALDIRAAFRKPGKPAWVKDRAINGFDTETADGDVFVLAYCWAGEEPEAIHNNGDPLDPDLVFRTLVHRNARASLNVWYNLDYDANCILKVLSDEALYRLHLFNESEHGDYRLTYIPRKLLSIRDSNKHKADHWDVAQYFYASLDNAAKEWLGEGKETFGVDVTRFGDESYRKANLDKIVAYAKIDAKRTRDIAATFFQTAESLDVPCGRPFSTGYLGEQRLNVEYRGKGSKPGYSFSGMQRLAWDAYKGGRFEIIQRGSIDDVVNIDINSAYPHVLSNLPDPGALRWGMSNNLDDIRSADYGFIRARVWTNPARLIQPFASRESGRLLFPSMSGMIVTEPIDTFLFALDNGYILDYRIEETWIAEDRARTRPFRFLLDLYETRKEYERAGRDKAAKVLKIIINSIYGKLCQTTEQKQIAEDGPADFYPIDLLPHDMQEWVIREGIEIQRKTRVGRYFNPFLASYITSRTRLQLLETIHRHGYEDHTVMLATDAVMIERAAWVKDPVEISGDLGGWDIDATGPAFVVGSGIYEIDDPAGRKFRTRGFRGGVGVFRVDMGESLRAVARATPGTSIPINAHRPLKIPQALWQNRPLDDVGAFQSFPRALRAGMDRKRRWERGDGVTWAELAETCERSVPLARTGENA